MVAPGSLVHIISRFVNRAFLLLHDAERFEYLSRARETFHQSDWRALSFALMSSHVHKPHSLVPPLLNRFAVDYTVALPDDLII